MTDEPAVLTVDEVSQALRIGRRQAYAAVEAGEIPAIRVGRSIRVPRAWVDRVTAGESTETGE